MASKKYVHFAVILITYISTIAIRYCHVPLQPDLQQFYGVSEKSIGYLMAMFYFPFCVGCLVFGFLGDRYNRKLIIVATLYGQAACVFLSGVATEWYLFVASKALVGVSQAAFITLAPTVIADMFNEGQRTTMIGLFASGAALGAGCGVITAGALGKFLTLAHTFYVFAAISGVCATAYLLIVPELERGASEKCDAKAVEVEQLKMERDSPCKEEKNSILDDIRYLLGNRTYMWAIMAYAGTSAVTETAMIWYVELLRRLSIVKGQQETCEDDYLYLMPNDEDREGSRRESYLTFGGVTICGDITRRAGPIKDPYDETFPKHLRYGFNGTTIRRGSETSIGWNINCKTCAATSISRTFGLISITCGMGGTLLGIAVMKALLKKYRNAGPLTSSGGQLLAVVSTTILMIVCRDFEMSIVWTLTALTFMFVTSCFGILADLIARVVLADKRALAFSIQNLVARTVGASLPPYIAGWIINARISAKTETWDFCDANGYPKSSDGGCEGLDFNNLNSTNFTNTYNMLDYQEYRFDALLVGFMVIPSYALIASILWLITAKYFTADEVKRINFGMGSIRVPEEGTPI